MKTAHFAHISASLAVLALAASFVNPPYVKAAAGGPQICVKETTCEVGEFLYDDSYVAITGSTCTITSKYPNGTPYLSSEPLTGQSDGWYSYQFTAPATTGMYRSTICCNVSGQNMCLDKTFEIQNEASGGGSSLSSNDIAAAVWGYSSRSLSSFGSLISDLWQFGTRTITGGSVTTTATLPSSDTAKLDALQQSVNANRNLLEQVVNKPIIETFVEEVPDLSVKLDQTKSAVGRIYADTAYMQSSSLSLASRWNKLSTEQVNGMIVDLKSRLGRDSDELLYDSLYGQFNWITNSWKWEISDQIKLAVKKTQSSLLALEDSFTKNGKSTVTYNAIKSFTKNLDSLDQLIGSSLDEAEQASLYGNLAAVLELNQSLAQQTQSLDQVLGTWTSISQNDKLAAIKKSSLEVSNLNRIPRLNSFFSTSNIKVVAGNELENKVFGLKGIVAANQQLLALNPDKTLASTWLELGSIVFKTVITNPSSLISQSVPLKYFLPEEVKKEHVMALDDGLSVEYDAETGKHYVAGEFTLGPGETKTVSVEVQDIWQFTEEKLNSIRREASSLSEPLKNTAYFAQGVTLTSDISSGLDRIIANNKSAITPEAKIRAYREAEIELNAVNEKLNKLKDLVASASSTGSLFGFVGGAQALAVWGIIIIMVAGFVFLALYMRVIRGKSNQPPTPTEGEENQLLSKPVVTHAKKHNKIKIAAHGLSYIILSIVVSGATVVAMKATESKTSQSEQVVLGETTTQEPEVEEELGKGGPKFVRVLVPRGLGVDVYTQYDSEEVSNTLTTTTKALELTRLGNKVEIKVESPKEITGWVNELFIQEADEQEVKTIIVNDTPTGFLRVRQTPGGTQVSQVTSGEQLPFIDENQDWYQIELPSGELGWVSKTYSTLN